MTWQKLNITRLKDFTFWEEIDGGVSGEDVIEDPLEHSPS